MIDELSKEEYPKGLDRAGFIKRFAHYYSELNVIHPFREGNGRSIRLFLSFLAYGAGWNVAWDAMDGQNNIEACEAAYLRGEEQLCNMLSPMVKKL